jgi:hypothetical protein
MAGNAKSIDFLVGTATIMLGLPADLRDFRPETHSIGLVKNVKLMAEATYIELTQGIRNSIVHSIKTGEPVRASAEVYEFNASNWSYALGFSGYNIVNTELETTVTTAVAASSLGTDTFDVTSATGYVVGDYAMMQVGYDDVVIPRRITATTSTTVTFDAPIKNVAVPIGAKIRRCLVVPVGRKSEQPFLAMKIVGSTADGREIAIEVPKLRVTKGFDIVFQTSDYANLPFEFTVYDQVPSDPQYARFQNEFDGSSATVYTTH